MWDEMKVELNKHEASEAIGERSGVGRRDGDNGKGFKKAPSKTGEDYFAPFINILRRKNPFHWMKEPEAKLR